MDRQQTTRKEKSQRRKFDSRMTSLVSSLVWVRQGVAAQRPEKYDVDDNEMQRISKLAQMELQDAQQELEQAKADANSRPGGDEDEDEWEDQDDENEPETIQDEPTSGDAEQGEKMDEDDMAKYNLDEYDDEPSKAQSIFSKVKGLSYYGSNAEDPYITLQDEEDEEEETDISVLSTDNMLLAAKTEDDLSHLEVYVYESRSDNLYVHHDILLPAFPLCMEWLDYRVGRKAELDGGGNYVAVGTFDPEIEIWDLDTIDGMYPDAILGRAKEAAPAIDSSNGKKKKKSKSKAKTKMNAEYHTDSVMDLSWNRNHRNVLASSSADTTVKIWDLQKLTCVRSLEHHSDKVQSVQWNPTEATVLLTGSYDKTVAAFDSRSPTTATQWKLVADVESLSWDHHQPTHFYVALENGMLQYYDVRTSSKPVFNLQAHDDAVTSFDINPVYRGYIATGSTDKTVKLWNVLDEKPSMITSRDLQVGRVFSTRFCPDAPFHLAAAGSKGEVQIWDTEPKTARYFSSAGEDKPEKPLIGVNATDDGDDSEDEDGSAMQLA